MKYIFTVNPFTINQVMCLVSCVFALSHLVVIAVLPVQYLNSVDICIMFNK